VRGLDVLGDVEHAVELVGIVGHAGALEHRAAVARIAVERQCSQELAPVVLDVRGQRKCDVCARACQDVGSQAARDPHRIGGIGDALARGRPVDVEAIGLERQHVG
jgi:hypothetical protein